MQILKTPIKVDQFLYKATRFHLSLSLSLPCSTVVSVWSISSHTVRFTVPPQCIRVNSYTEPLASTRLSSRQKCGPVSGSRHWTYRPGSVFCTSQATDHIGFQILKLFSFSIRPGHTPVSFHSPGTPLSSLLPKPPAGLARPAT